MFKGDKRTILDRVIVRPKDAVRKTEGGIIIPDQGLEVPAEGDVLGVGPRVQEVKVGDHIYYSKYACTEVKVDEEVVLILREEDVLLVT